MHLATFLSKNNAAKIKEIVSRIRLQKDAVFILAASFGSLTYSERKQLPFCRMLHGEAQRPETDVAGIRPETDNRLIPKPGGVLSPDGPWRSHSLVGT